MRLSKLRKGDSAEIINIHADTVLKSRLSSFGVVRGEMLKIKGCSLAKKTMEIEIENTLIALREAEANMIEVKKI